MILSEFMFDRFSLSIIDYFNNRNNSNEDIIFSLFHCAKFEWL